MYNFLFKGKYLFFILTFLLIIKYFIPEKSSSSQPSTYDLVYKKTRLHYAPPFPDSLPWKTYQRKEDSIRREFSLDNPGGGSFRFLNFGLTEIDKNFKVNYLVFHGYEFDDENENFYFKKLGKKYFTYPEYENKNKNFSSFSYVTKETQMEIDQHNDQGKIGLLFPVNKTVYIMLFIFFGLIALGMIVFILHVCLYLPLRILYNISKGNSFIDENIGSLYTMGRVFLLTGAVVSLAKLIPHLFIRQKLPPFITFPYYEAVMSGWGLIVIGIIILIIARAFLEGSEMKEEQDLTV
jgi:hypothetical protein